MKNIQIRDEFIKLGQALKLSGLADSGTEAKQMVLNEEVLVNGEICVMRGKKLYLGDTFGTSSETFQVVGI